MLLKELNRSTVASGKHLKLLQIELEGGKIYDAASRVGNKNAVAGLLRHTENNTYILIEQYRYPLKKKVLELVAGIIDKPGKSVEDIMKEEIKEETGYQNIETITFLSETSASAGAFTETTKLFDVEISGAKEAQELGDLEDISVFEIPYTDFDSFLASKNKSGTIIDPKVCMAIYMTLAKTIKNLR